MRRELRVEAVKKIEMNKSVKSLMVSWERDSLMMRAMYSARAMVRAVGYGGMTDWRGRRRRRQASTPVENSRLLYSQTQNIEEQSAKSTYSLKVYVTEGRLTKHQHSSQTLSLPIFQARLHYTSNPIRPANHQR
jgi:hypothetical protein